MKPDRRPPGKLRGAIAGLCAIGALAALAGCERPPMQETQIGYRGTGMVQIRDPRVEAVENRRNAVPAPIPALQLPPGLPVAGAIYHNVQVLRDVPVPEFGRLMASIASWVAPQQQCGYCHEPANMASDALYTKRVARRMLQMTRYINTHWTAHVGSIGVTCYTCHRGAPVPSYIWYAPAAARSTGLLAVNSLDRHVPNTAVGDSSLPSDPFSEFLAADPLPIRVQSTSVLRQDGLGASIQSTERTYGLMMQISQSLGVNCSFCHETRAFSDWSQSTPQRVTAWQGIRMVRDLNVQFLEPLAATFPAYRHGPAGDGPKLDCATCHQGFSQPLDGVSMVVSYPELK